MSGTVVNINTHGEPCKDSTKTLAQRTDQGRSDLALRSSDPLEASPAYSLRGPVMLT